MSYEVKVVHNFEDLPVEVQEDYPPDYGFHRDFLLVYYEGRLLFYKDAHIEPKDIFFSRDLSWVAERLREAYKLGFKNRVPVKNRGHGDPL